MSDTLTYPDVVSWAVPFFIAAIMIELAWITLKGRGGRYETRDAVTSLIMGAGNVASGIALGFIAWAFSWRYGRSRRWTLAPRGGWFCCALCWMTCVIIGCTALATASAGSGPVM